MNPQSSLASVFFELSLSQAPGQFLAEQPLVTQSARHARHSSLADLLPVMLNVFVAVRRLLPPKWPVHLPSMAVDRGE
jgi:hypothetical protein